MFQCVRFLFNCFTFINTNGNRSQCTKACDQSDAVLVGRQLIDYRHKLFDLKMPNATTSTSIKYDFENKFFYDGEQMEQTQIKYWQNALTRGFIYDEKLLYFVKTTLFRIISAV